VGEGRGAYKAQRLEALGTPSYPYNFTPTMQIPAFLHAYSSLEGEEAGQEEVAVAGMVVGVREAGKHLRFVDLEGQGARVQLKVDSRRCDGEAAVLRRGDRVGVHGVAVRTRAGELSLAASSLALLAPCLRPLPTHGFHASHKRLQRRYLDLMTSSEAREVLVTRSRIVRYIREFLHQRDFLEVETPVLAGSVGGATARPFTTHHHDMDAELHLRVAPELHLKQLVISGFDRVFEIGKQFRNEGVDASHNPEFTSCEFYLAWADYSELVSLTQALLAGLVTSLELRPTHRGQPLDFTAQFPAVEFLPALEAAVGARLAPPEELGSEGSRRQLAELCRREGLEGEGSAAKLLDRLAGRLVEPELVQPTLLTHHPTVMSPLAKPHRELPGIAERFELFVGGQELCNAYTELNDPEAQRAALALQASARDPEAMPPDEDYCLALEYGLPPTAGWGCGIDRLAAVMTNSTHIRDTLTFPLVARPKG